MEITDTIIRYCEAIEYRARTGSYRNDTEIDEIRESMTAAEAHDMASVLRRIDEALQSDEFAEPSVCVRHVLHSIGIKIES